MRLTLETIANFIRKHATQASIERAQDYHPLPDYQQNEIAVGRLNFVCEGSGKRIYQQTLLFNKKGIQSATCTCPYSGRGICKHAVAALLALVNNPYVQQMAQPAQAKQAPKSAPLPLRPVSLPLSDDSLLDFAAAREAFKQHQIKHSSSDCAIVSRETGKWAIEVPTGAYPCCLVLEAKEGAAQLSCSCNSAWQQGYCSHGLQILNFAEKRLGADCLRDDFLEKRIAAFLQNYGLTLQDDYSSLFEFSFGRNGLEVKHKVPDLMPADFALPEYAPTVFQAA